MAEVFEVTRAQLAEWESNWQVFSYNEKSRDDGSRWLLASIGIGYCGRPFAVTAWADGTAQDRESACNIADDYNTNYLEDMVYGEAPEDLECEVWHVVDAIPVEDDYEITGAGLREIEELADKLIYFYTKETGVTDLSIFKDADGRLWGGTDHNEGYLWAAQQLRDIVADVAKTPVQKTIGYIEVYQQDEDDYSIFKREYFDNEEDARADFEGRTYVPCGMHNMARMIGHGPSFKHIQEHRMVVYPNYWD